MFQKSYVSMVMLQIFLCLDVKVLIRPKCSIFNVSNH
jgi:hypothetical protein